MISKLAFASFIFIALLWSGQIAEAGYKEDMGFTQLQSELGGSMPTGSGIYATQVEARTSYGDPLGPYMPNTADSQFSGKTIVKKTTDSVSGSSSHAITVGRLFYGNTSSLSWDYKYRLLRGQSFHKQRVFAPRVFQTAWIYL